MIFLQELHKTSYRSDSSVCSIIADLDSISGIGCMNDLSVAHVNCNMSAVADQISRLSICIRYFVSCILLLIGSSRKAYAKVRIYALNKSGAVSTTGKACAAPYIWITNKLCSIIYNRRSGTGRTAGR